jgi:hexosaminidase
VADITGDADTAGTVTTVRIPAGVPAEDFGLLMQGYIMIPADGTYSFYTGSDDGVRIYIDGELVVDGDEIHHGITNEGRVALKSGMHSITVRYFQRLYRQSLSLSWEGPGVARQSVPAEVLFQ